MKKRKHRREIEENKDTKRGRHNPNECETEDNKDMLSDLPDCILLHILSFLNAKDGGGTCLLSTRWKHLWRNLPTKDTLSKFPDCVLLHILSFLSAKDAVGTCLLSTRWKHLWKRLPILNLRSFHFKTRKDFTKFVNKFLTLRNSSTALNVLDMECGFREEPLLLNRIFKYAVSHNVTRLKLCCIHHISSLPPFSLFSCPSLTSLDLGYPNTIVIFPNFLNLPALTYLKLYCLSFCSGDDGRLEPFSTFNRLNTLILDDCEVRDEQPLCISSTTLLNLSMFQVNSKIELSTPNLCTFDFFGTNSAILKFYGSSPFSIKQVSINAPLMEPLILLNLLIEFANMKLLKISATTLRVLSLVPDLLKVEPPWFNLKSLKMNFFTMRQRDVNYVPVSGKSWKENAMLREAIKARLEPYSSIHDVMIDFLLQNSPSAKVDILTI